MLCGISCLATVIANSACSLSLLAALSIVCFAMFVVVVVVVLLHCCGLINFFTLQHTLNAIT